MLELLDDGIPGLDKTEAMRLLYGRIRPCGCGGRKRVTEIYCGPAEQGQFVRATYSCDACQRAYQRDRVVPQQ